MTRRVPVQCGYVHQLKREPSPACIDREIVTSQIACFYVSPVKPLV